MKYKTDLIKVRYCETDQMGIVHHSNYLKFFEHIFSSKFFNLILKVFKKVLLKIFFI